MSEVSILVQPFQHIKTQSDTFFLVHVHYWSYVSLGVFRAINPVNMSFLPPAVLSSKCGKKAHINVYETFCLSMPVQFTSGVFVKGSSWTLSGSCFISTDDVAISSVGSKLYLHHRVCAILCVNGPFWHRKNLWCCWQIHAEWSVAVVTQALAVLQLTAVILVCIVISSGPSFHSSQDTCLFPFRFYNLVPLRWLPLVFHSSVQLEHQPHANLR